MKIYCQHHSKELERMEKIFQEDKIEIFLEEKIGLKYYFLFTFKTKENKTLGTSRFVDFFDLEENDLLKLKEDVKKSFDDFK